MRSRDRLAALGSSPSAAMTTTRLRFRLARPLCLVCRERFRKPQLIEHLAACPLWSLGPRPWVFLLLEGAPASRNWSVLAADAAVTLAGLDQFVRENLFLPIAGVSSFGRGARGRRDHVPKPDQMLAPDTRLDRLIEPDLKLWYDLGDFEPAMSMRVLVERKGPSAVSKINLVARHPEDS